MGQGRRGRVGAQRDRCWVEGNVLGVCGHGLPVRREGGVCPGIWRIGVVWECGQGTRLAIGDAVDVAVRAEALRLCVGEAIVKPWSSPRPGSAARHAGVRSRMAHMFPPAPEVAVSTRDLVERGRLIQRELVTHESLGKSGADRGLGTGHLDRQVWESWDRDRVLCPLAFYVGMRETQRLEGAYPMPLAKRDATRGEWAEAGYIFRDETDFRPWGNYEYTIDSYAQVQPLYSEWQLLALPLVLDGEYMRVPVTVLAGDETALVEWASGMRREFAKGRAGGRQMMHDNWLATVKILVRLQARYWPYVSGKSKVLYAKEPQAGDRPTLDAMQFEYQDATAQEALAELGVTMDDLLTLYEWLAWRVESGADPQKHLRSLTRLLPRRRAEQARGQSRQALDIYDACQVVRRFYLELTGALLPDADEGYVIDNSVAARPLRKDRDALIDALRIQGLTAHKLHVLVEGETEMRLIRGLFEAFAGTTLQAAGIAMTDLEGDKLVESRRFIEGFGLYARDVALLLDDENDAKRVVRQLVKAGVVNAPHAELVSPSLEEANFSPDELVAMANQLGAARGVTLGFTGADLKQKLDEYNARAGDRPLGMASMLVKMARNPTLGPTLQIGKPELAQPMIDFLLAEIAAAPGKHEEVAQNRPIVDWVLRFPMQASRIP